MTRRIGFFIFADFQLLDLTGPLAAFHVASQVAGTEPYALHVLSAKGGLVASTAGLRIPSERAGLRALDTLLVAGGSGSRAVAKDPRRLELVRALAARSRRAASVCTGAFILAAAGLLDGRRATTHWRAAASLQRDYPRVKVEGERIFVKDGSLWTSAGITAGIDLALALIEEDLGSGVSRAAARELVVYHRRPGGQSQFSAMQELEPESDPMRLALAFARGHLSEALTVERLAAAARLSERQFGRVFRRETGETPGKAVERLRVEAARLLIEESSEPIESIASSVGFRDPERMRRAFLRRIGQPPQALRRSARQSKRV